MNVLSLFDGISCGQIALQRAGINVDGYFASEIKEIAIRVTQHHFPNTIQLGDVREIKAADLPHIDLLIGGSPCQNFSSVNLTERSGLDGEKSGLFYEYLRLLNELKPNYFLLENVCMNKADRDKISQSLGVEPISINSCLVSAQSRPRLYWTNIPNVTQPDDKNIMLQDVLTDGYAHLKKSRCLLLSDCRPLRTPVKIHHRGFIHSFVTPIYKSKDHFDMCCQHYNNNYLGMSARDINCDSDIYDGIRLLNKTEREKLQTLPPGYCEMLSEKDAANVIGDGWTVDVIAHILKNIPG